MYVVLICADYGTGVWGSWSAPIRFITQNLIQLQLTYVGESFIDIEWRRAPNKKLPKIDEGAVLLNPTAQGQGHSYEVQVCWKDPQTNKEVDERRSMTDCSVFRVTVLDLTRYNTPCESGTRREWGLWSGVRSVPPAGIDNDSRKVSLGLRSRGRQPRQKLPSDDALAQIPVKSRTICVWRNF